MSIVSENDLIDVFILSVEWNDCDTFVLFYDNVDKPPVSIPLLHYTIVSNPSGYNWINVR